MIIAGYRCVDCYINKIDKIPDKPYKEVDFNKEYDNDWKIPDPLDQPQLRFPYLGTGTGTQDLFDRLGENTTAGTATYNPWFRRTWANNSAIQDSSTVAFSTSSSAQNVTD